MSYGLPKFAYWPTYDQGREGSYCSAAVCRAYWLYVLIAQQFRENTEFTLLRPINSKESPQIPLWFLTTGIGIYGPNRIWFTIWRKLLANKESGDQETAIKKGGWKKIFKCFFIIKKCFLNFTFLLLLQNSLKFNTKKGTSQNFFIFTVKQRRNGH